MDRPLTSVVATSCTSLARAYRLLEPLFYVSCASKSYPLEQLSIRELSRVHIAFTSLRAWALSGRNRGFTVFIILLCLAPTVTDWVRPDDTIFIVVWHAHNADQVAYHWVQVRNHPAFGCMNGSTIPGPLASQ